MKQFSMTDLRLNLSVGMCGVRIVATVQGFKRRERSRELDRGEIVAIRDLLGKRRGHGL
jgi:hypothetical protein